MQKEIDCFVTHDPVSSSDPEAPNVDEYVGAVWSVELHRPIATKPYTELSGLYTHGFPCSDITIPVDLTNAAIAPLFKITDQALAPLVTSGYISNGFEVTISTDSSVVVCSDEHKEVLEPGQSFYMVIDYLQTTGNDVFFALAWKPFTDFASASWVNLSHLASITPSNSPVTIGAATPTQKAGVKFLFREKAPVAYVVNSATSWIMAAYADAPVDLEVGDRVRMGATTLGGFTDYCTVLEKVPITQLGCGIFGIDNNGHALTGKLTFNGMELHYSDRNTTSGGTRTPLTTRVEMLGNKARGTAGTTAVPQLVDLPSTAKFPYEATAHDTAWYAYRVSANVDCTLPPVDFTSRCISDLSASKQERLKHRAAITFDDAWASKGQTPRKPGERRRFFPCFRLRNDLSKPLVVPFGHTVKCIHEVKLHSYSLFSAAQDTEYQHGHELNPTNWIAMELAGVQGEVMSNNPHANGAFAILHAGAMHKDSTSGINEHYETHPQGLVKVKFERPISTMRELRVSFRNSKGVAPRAARIHLWFKLWVTQG